MLVERVGYDIAVFHDKRATGMYLVAAGFGQGSHRWKFGHHTNYLLMIIRGML